MVDPDSDSDHENDIDDGKSSGRKQQVINSTHAGKIIAAEEDEDVRVTFMTYKKLFAPGGGWCTIVAIQIAMCCFVFCNIAATYYTQKWAYASPEDQQD